MKHYIILITALISLGFLLNCEKLVEIDAPNNQISTAAVFQDTNTADAALANLLAEIRNNSLLSGGNRGMGALLASYADDLDGYYINNINASMDIYNNQPLAGNTIVESTWQNAYKEIYMANAIIEGLKSSSIPEADRKRISGTALLIRSVIYFNLQRIFGDIPYTDTTDFEINKRLKKMTADAIFIQVEKDLQESSRLLEDNYTNAERLYPNRKVVHMVLADLYLTQREWQKAESAAKEVINSPLYLFEGDIKKAFLKLGKHILWQLKPQNINDGTAEAQLYYFDNAAPPSYALSTSLVNAFSNTDLRKENWMKPVTFNQQTWYRPYKYKSLSPNTTEYSILFRLEQAYFIVAEALAQQNRVGEALPYINAVRQRAALSALPGTLSKDQFLEELIKEKRREFFTEGGQRFYDLKRFGRLQDLKAVKPNWNNFNQLWPIPLSELLLNANLNPQNEGY
ncbi:RagB/SusD family nutrient uptake outer membrane protein [Epilithonimonas lactis]|uniref:Glycan metabolism protein RagB n=1 Tax=Epilithonimonas lactis TaxID=421072 RepID=A0A085B9G9_9FLAO|nr:RagB/SusD family nutrient uptake outer membrane protein [Epilithonimonas lactis]KFC19114.1 glycan metabolism protein RagB [Epilithonimonas lactis]SEQ92446.1 RagB/SusD domain-containing protein [Epilithonimonas lactis]